MTRWNYTKGLHDLGNGCWAYLQPDGSWGWSNAGLISDGEVSLLVDTLFDLKLTGVMLDAMRAADPAAVNIDTLVNTHANGDHCYGNQLVSGATIIASKASAQEMNELPPETMAQLLENADQMGPAGAFFAQVFGRFLFDGIVHTPPTQTFSGEHSRMVGDKRVNLIEDGPAHTKGDVLVHVPGDDIVFTGDILFIDGTPIIWEGPVENWLAACDRIMALELDAIVPGHGPITDKKGAIAVRTYLEYISKQARERFDAGMDAFEAAQDISLSDYSAWGDAERIAVNVATLFREFSGSDAPANIGELFAQMATLAGRHAR